MKTTASRAELCMTAFRALSRSQKKAFVQLILDDPELREDLMDLAVMQQREDEPSRPFRDYLAERAKRAR